MPKRGNESSTNEYLDSCPVLLIDSFGRRGEREKRRRRCDLVVVSSNIKHQADLDLLGRGKYLSEFCGSLPELNESETSSSLSDVRGRFDLNLSELTTCDRKTG